MKPRTLVLSCVLAAMLAFLLVFSIGAKLRVEVGCVSAKASEHPKDFEDARDRIANGDVFALYTHDLPADPSDCALVDLSLTVHNNGLFDAEYLNVSIDGIAGDIAVYELSGNGTDIPAHESTTLDLKLLTRAEADAPRTITLRYYVFGILKTVKAETK